MKCLKAHAMEDDDYKRRARQYLDHVIAQTGLTATEVARAAGLASSTLTRFLNKKNVKHTLSTKSLAKIAMHTGHALPSELGGGLLTQTKPSLRYGEVEKVDSPTFSSGLRDLPVQGSALGGGDETIVFNDSVTAHIERPNNLIGHPLAYAVYVHGTSMEPAYTPGELLYVNPAKPPIPGKDVVVQLKDGRGLIKRLKRRSGGKVVLEQFNPAKEITISQEQITSIHLVVGSWKDSL